MLKSPVHHDKFSKPGYLLASVSILIFIALASLAIVLQYIAFVSNSANHIANTQSSISSANAGLSSATQCLMGNRHVTVSSLSPNHVECADGGGATNLNLGTNLSFKSTFQVNATKDAYGVKVSSTGTATGGSTDFTNNLKVNLPLVGSEYFQSRLPGRENIDSAGANNFNQPERIAAGEGHSCYISEGNGLYCWGRGDKYQLGTRSTNNSSRPLLVDLGANTTKVKSVAVGSNHTCVSLTGGEVYCWGDNQFGKLGIGSQSTKSAPTRVGGDLLSANILKVSAGPNNTCAVASTGVWCWGANYRRQLGNFNTNNSHVPWRVGLPAGLTPTDVDVGEDHACAVVSNGDAYCWGANGGGRLGTINISGCGWLPCNNRWNPRDPGRVLMPSGVRVKQISAGKEQTCAVSTVGGLYCWGQERNAVIGNGSETPLGWRSTPVRIAVSLGTAHHVSTGQWHACATFTGGKVACWGNNDGGRLGTNNNTMQRVPKIVTHNVSSKEIAIVASGYYHTCIGERTGNVMCMGQGAFGKLGNRDTKNELTAQTVKWLPEPAGTSANPYVTTNRPVATGGSQTCALDDMSKTYCWGYAGYAAIGTGTFNGTDHQATPQKTLTPGNLANEEIIEVTTGLDHSCQISDSGNLYCWGRNTGGRLGNGTTTNKSSPTLIAKPTDAPSSSSWTSISAGQAHTCGVINKSVYCWGDNSYGQLGKQTTSNTTNNYKPTKVSNHSIVSADGGVVKVAAGFYHTCALTYKGTVFCWGSNASGQLGTGNTSSQTAPSSKVDTSDIPPESRVFIDISTSRDHSCAVSSSGSAYCWGSSLYGKLGTTAVGTAEKITYPVRVQADTSISPLLRIPMHVTSISAGERHTCLTARQILSPTKSSVYCTGDNTYGQLGNGTISGTSVRQPQTVVGDITSKDMVYVSSNNWHNCVLTTDNDLYCWGRGTFGRIGNGNTTNTPTPTRIKMDSRRYTPSRWVY